MGRPDRPAPAWALGCVAAIPRFAQGSDGVA